MRQGINVGLNVGAVRMLNNTWDHITEEAVIFNDTRSGADQIINNIFYDVGGGGDSYACIPSGSPTIETNDFYMPGGGSPGSWCSNAPYMSFDPMFVNDGDSTGIGANYSLQNSSPARSDGTSLAGVTDDYTGNTRPLSGDSIGAYQQ